MNDSQALFIRETYEYALHKIPQAAHVLFQKLIELSPESERFFQNSSGQQRQAMLQAAIHKIVGSVENWEKTKPELELIAAQHINYGLRPEHIAYFGQSFIYMMQHIFDRDWNNELEDAWRAIYQRIAEVMINVVFWGR
ncbi:MAG: globin domain-containing protein [Thermonemataceae bacterium]|nr:globin domain-containing protein [Thermonemataceae bacterium]